MKKQNKHKELVKLAKEAASCLEENSDLQRDAFNAVLNQLLVTNQINSLKTNKRTNN